MKQPHAHITFLFVTLGIVAILLLLTDMATGDTFIPISKVWAVLTGGECDEITRNILLSIRFVRVAVAGLIGIALSVSGLQMQTVFQNPLADPYLLGVSSGAGLGVALCILGAPLLGWIAAIHRNHRFRMDRYCRHPAGSSRHQPESQEHSGSSDHGSHDRLCSRRHHPDIAIYEFCRTAKSVHTVVDGLTRSYHNDTVSHYGPHSMYRTRGFHRLHQTAELAAAWRKLCTDDGNEYQTLTDTHFHIYRPTDGNSYRLLRSGWIYRIGRAAHHTIVIQQCRPSCARSGNNTYGTYRYAALRHYRQKIPASGQLYYRPVGSSGHFMGNC